jgi:hypothetical protein
MLEDLKSSSLRKVMGPGLQPTWFDMAVLQCLVSSKALGRFFIAKKYKKPKKT